MEWLADNFWYIVGVIAIYAVWWFLGWLLERSQKGALKMNKKYVYACIRLLALALIIGGITYYFNDQINYYQEQTDLYKDKMFVAMEERDKALAQITSLELDIEKATSYPGRFLQEKAAKERTQRETELTNELSTATQKIHELELRWDILVEQKDDYIFLSMLSSYIGDKSAMVYHTANCDLLKVIDRDDKVDLGQKESSIRSNYKPCKWCIE